MNDLKPLHQMYTTNKSRYITLSTEKLACKTDNQKRYIVLEMFDIDDPTWPIFNTKLHESDIIALVFACTKKKAVKLGGFDISFPQIDGASQITITYAYNGDMEQYVKRAGVFESNLQDFLLFMKLGETYEAIKHINLNRLWVP